MSAHLRYHCNACGSEVDAATASQFMGIWQGQAAVAAGHHDWHSCSARCAATLLLSVANAMLDRADKLEADAAKSAAYREDFARKQAAALARLDASAPEGRRPESL